MMPCTTDFKLECTADVNILPSAMPILSHVGSSADVTAPMLQPERLTVLLAFLAGWMSALHPKAATCRVSLGNPKQADTRHLLKGKLVSQEGAQQETCTMNQKHMSTSKANACPGMATSLRGKAGRTSTF